MTTTQSRIVGSGFTAIFFDGKTIALLDTFRDSGQAPVTSPEEVHVLGGSFTPTEIATTRVVSAGRLDVSLRDAWNQYAWSHLLTLANVNAANVTHIGDAQALLDSRPGAPLSMSMILSRPGSTAKSGKTYHNLTITSLGDGEQVAVGTLTVPRTISFMYTHATQYRR